MSGFPVWLQHPKIGSCCLKSGWLAGRPACARCRERENTHRRIKRADSFRVSLLRVCVILKCLNLERHRRLQRTCGRQQRKKNGAGVYVHYASTGVRASMEITFFGGKKSLRSAQADIIAAIPPPDGLVAHILVAE